MRSFSYNLCLRAALCVLLSNLSNHVIADEWVSPLLNTESIAGVGETILHQGKLEQRAAIHLSEEIQFGKDKAYTLTPGYYVRTSESVGWEFYSPADGPRAGRVKKAPDAITVQGSFHYSNDGKTIGIITNFYQAVNAKAKGITRTIRPALTRTKTQRFLVYGGMSGTKIRLSYRELWKNITRPSDAVFIEYDLADTNIVEHKGAKIEVIEATEKELRYRVTQVFES